MVVSFLTFNPVKANSADDKMIFFSARSVLHVPKKFVFYSEISKIITALSPYLQAKSVADDFLKFIYRFFYFFYFSEIINLDVSWKLSAWREAM